jgi:hypothetical protein
MYRARSAACIALFPTGNSIGSWVRSRVRRSNIEKLVTTEQIINIMNAVVAEEREQEHGQRNVIGSDQGGNPAETQAGAEVKNPEESQEESQEESPAINPAESPIAIQEETMGSAEESKEESEANVVEEEAAQPTITIRLGRPVVGPSRFAAVTKVAQKEWQQEQSKIAIKKELQQLFKELVAIVPVQ